MRNAFKSFFRVLLSILPCLSFGQQYFKLLEKSAQPYEQKIARFSNSDLLIGGSPLRGKTASQNGGVNILRLDPCGKVLWTRNFQWKANYLVFKDFAIAPNDEVYVFGSAFEGTNEYIFLLKLSPKGKELAFQIIHMGTADNFTYTLKVLPDGRLFAYGLLLDFNTPKRGFIAVFDNKLTYQWGKVFGPFESNGEAIIAGDGGLLCRSGVYLFKFKSNGELEWANMVQAGGTGEEFFPVAGPIPVRNGYLFEALHENTAFFYQTDFQGRFQWKSPLFKSSKRAADLKILENGDVLAVYNDPATDQNYPSLLRLNSSGQILFQRRLRTEQALQTESIYQTLGRENTVTIIGTQDLKAASSERYAGFLLQASLDSLNGNCFRWENFQSIQPNNAPVNIQNLLVNFFPLNVRYLESRIDEVSLEYKFATSCDLSRPRITRQDSALRCGQSWSISLPNENFRWEDGEPANPRILNASGTYRASDFNCVVPTIFEYHINKQPCPCQAYLPNAFSPNGDDKNEKLSLSSNCKMEKMHLRVFSRWGELVYDEESENPSWDGRFKGQEVKSGVFLVRIEYQAKNENDELVQGSMTGEVMVVK
jgi:gliding motility-associated-like protein